MQKLKSEHIENQIEALIYSSLNGISLTEIKLIMSVIIDYDIEIGEIEERIIAVSQKYEKAHLSIELVSLNGGYQFLTKKEYYPVIKQLHAQRSKKALSQAALETLAIIAYKHPVTKLEVEQIRGVNCDYSIQKLLDKELISITGRSETVGKPIIYSVSPLFLDYFGINSSADLPKIKDLLNDHLEIGNKSGLTDSSE